MTPLVLLPLERFLVEHELDARLLSNPLTDLPENLAEVVRFLWSPIDDGEVKIFRESERLVVALAEACPALEHPRLVQLFVLCDPRQEPPEYVVFLDNSLVENPLRSKKCQLPFRDHETPSFATATFTRRPQRTARRPPSGPSWSRAEIPDDSLTWQADTRSGRSRSSVSMR